MDRLAGCVANKVLAALAVANRNERALGRADAHREDPDAERRRLLRCHNAIGVQFLAIGHNDKCAGVPLGFSKGFPGRGDRRCDVGAPFGNNVGIEFAQGIDHSRVVQRERGLEEGRSGESDKSDPVIFEQAHQILREKFRPGEAVGSDIGGQHAARGIHGDDDVAALLFDLLLGETIARLGEGDEDERKDGQQEKRTENPAGDADRSGKLVEQARGHNLRHQGASATLRPGVEEREQRQNQKPPKPDRRAKCQGSRLHKVCESRISAPRQARPAMRNQGKRSR